MKNGVVGLRVKNEGGWISNYLERSLGYFKDTFIPNYIQSGTYQYLVMVSTVQKIKTRSKCLPMLFSKQILID